MKQGSNDRKGPGGLAGWLIANGGRWFTKMRRTESNRPRLALVERINLAPKQSLALVEAEGKRLLVAISADGSPAFFALDGNIASTLVAQNSGLRANKTSRTNSRVSW